MQLGISPELSVWWGNKEKTHLLAFCQDGPDRHGSTLFAPGFVSTAAKPAHQTTLYHKGSPSTNRKPRFCRNCKRLRYLKALDVGFGYRAGSWPGFIKPKRKATPTPSLSAEPLKAEPLKAEPPQEDLCGTLRGKCQGACCFLCFFCILPTLDVEPEGEGEATVFFLSCLLSVGME